MASVAFGKTVAAVAPAGRRRRPTVVVPAATRGGQAAPAKEEKGLAEFIVGAIFKKDQLLLETDPLLNKVDPAPSSSGGTASRKVGGTTSVAKKPAGGDDGGDGGGFNLGGLFAKKG